MVQFKRTNGQLIKVSKTSSLASKKQAEIERQRRIRSQQQRQVQQKLSNQKLQVINKINEFKNKFNNLVKNLQTEKDKKFTSTRGIARRRAQLKGFEETIKLLSTDLNKLNQGESINIDSTLKKAQSVRTDISRKTRAGLRKDVPLKTQELQKLSATTRRAQPSGTLSFATQKIIEKAQTDKILSVSDFRQARKDGITSNQLLNFKVQNQPSQAQRLFTKKLKEIDSNKNLTLFEKEKLKRELIGVPTGPQGQQTVSLFVPLSQKEIKESFQKFSPGIKNKTNPVRQFENKLRDEYLRILNKPLSQRTDKEMALISVLGTSAAALGTARKVPGVIFEIAAAILSPVDTVKGFINLLTDKGTQQSVNRKIQELGARLQQGDPDAVSTVLAEIFGTKGANALLSGKGLRELSKLRPDFVKFKNGQIVLKAEPTITKHFSTVKEFLKGTKPKKLNTFNKNPEIILKKQTVATGGKPLSKQALLAGQTVTAVNTAADQLTSFISRKKLIRKPIPGEADFPASIKRILTKFDSGTKLTKTEFVNVNKWLQNNVAKNITLLERSLYLDPESGFRISRLGITKERKATLKDILRGNFTLRGPKPQVLIFQNAKVAKFPKELKDIEKKLKADKKLTSDETNRLIAWQVKSGSGKFKPVGSTIYKGGVELEVTLAPGEFIKRIRQVGFTFIEGKKVSFVTAEVWKPSKAILKKVDDANNGKLTDKQVKALEKDLSKRLGRGVRVDTPKSKTTRSFRQDVPVLRVKGNFLRVLRKTPEIRKPTTRKPVAKKPVTRTPTTRKPITKKPVTRKPTTRKPITRKPVTRKPTTRKPITRKPVTRKPTIRPPTIRRAPVGSKPPREPRRIRFSTKNLPKGGTRQGYIVRIKVGNTIVAQTSIKSLLPSKRATNLGRLITDGKRGNFPLSASFDIKGIGKTDIKDVKKTILKQKFRVKRGKDPLVRKNVEKKAFRRDTKKEVKALKKAKKKTIKKKSKKK